MILLLRRQRQRMNVFLRRKGNRKVHISYCAPLEEENRQAISSLRQCVSSLQQSGPSLRDVSFGVEPGRIVGVIGLCWLQQNHHHQILAGLIPQLAARSSTGGKPFTTEHRILPPEKTYLSDWMKVGDALGTHLRLLRFRSLNKAHDMLDRFPLDQGMPVKNCPGHAGEATDHPQSLSRRLALHTHMDEP